MNVKPRKQQHIIRAVVFVIFVFWILGFPRIVPYTYPDGQYYWTYIQDSWSIFFAVVLYPSACLISGALCALIRYRPMVLWVIPDLLVCLPEFFDRADRSSGFRWDTFALNVLLHLLVWGVGFLLMHGIRRLTARIYRAVTSWKEEYRTYQKRIDQK